MNDDTLVRLARRTRGAAMRARALYDLAAWHMLEAPGAPEEHRELSETENDDTLTGTELRRLVRLLLKVADAEWDAEQDGDAADALTPDEVASVRVLLAKIEDDGDGDDEGDSFYQRLAEEAE